MAQLSRAPQRGAAQRYSSRVCSILGQCVANPRGYHGDWSPLGSAKATTRGAAGPKDFWPLRETLTLSICPDRTMFQDSSQLLYSFNEVRFFGRH